MTPMLFDPSPRWLGHSEPITQSALAASWGESIFLDGMSLGLLSVGQYFQSSTEKSLLISLTLFCTNCFHSLSTPLIQQSATSELHQHVIVVMGALHFRAPSTAVTNRACMAAPKSYSLGIVWL